MSRGLNMERRRAAIEEAVVEVAGRLVYGTPKTHQSRTVPVPRFLVEELDRLVAGKGPRRSRLHAGRRNRCSV